MLGAGATEINLTQSLTSQRDKHLEERFERNAMPFEEAGRGKVFRVKQRACGKAGGKEKLCHVLG